MKKVILLIVLAGVLAVGAIGGRKYFAALQHGKQKATMGDMRNVGNAWVAFVTDKFAALDSATEAKLSNAPVVDFRFTGTHEAKSGKYRRIPNDILADMLVPHYIKVLPQQDGWGNAFEYYVSMDDKTAHLIRSPGRDGNFSGTTYTGGKFDQSDYDEDILCANGHMVRYPF